MPIRGDRVFRVPRNEAGDSLLVKITEPDIRADQLGLETWASGSILANLVHRLDAPRFPNGRSINPDSTVPIIELGAGTGLVGITAAALWKVPVLLTDLGPIVPGLVQNLEINTALFEGDAQKSTAGTLDWNSPSSLTFLDTSGETTISSTNKAHIIFAADTVYSEEHPRLLSNVILEWLSRDPDARAIITYALRVAYLDEIRELWQLLEAGGLEAVNEGQDTADAKDFDDERLCEWSVWKWRQEPLSSASV